MRKAWQRFFLLCVACMICMSGLCLAKDGNWIKYHNHDSSKYYVDPSSLKAREYEGRKYLEANVDIGGSQMLIVLDIENQKYIVLEGHNHLTGKTTNTDISQMSQQSPTFSGIPIYEKLIRWVEKNRPDVINEIRTNNLTAPPLPSAPQPAPGANTGATGSPNVPRGSLEAIVGDIEYEVLDSGAVKFVLQRGVPQVKVNDDYYKKYPDRYWTTYTHYLFAKPEEFKAWPGAYAVASIVPSTDSNCLSIMAFFDYDIATNTIQWYSGFAGRFGVEYEHDPENAMYERRMRVIDKDSVYVEEADLYGPTVAEGKFRLDTSGIGNPKYTVKYVPCDLPDTRDVNGRGWLTTYGSEPYFNDMEYDFIQYEAAIICCSLKGNLGEIPLGEDFEYFAYSSKYQFSR